MIISLTIDYGAPIVTIKRKLPDGYQIINMTDDYLFFWHDDNPAVLKQIVEIFLEFEYCVSLQCHKPLEDD